MADLKDRIAAARAKINNEEETNSGSELEERIAAARANLGTTGTPAETVAPANQLSAGVPLSATAKPTYGVTQRLSVENPAMTVAAQKAAAEEKSAPKDSAGQGQEDTFRGGREYGGGGREEESLLTQLKEDFLPDSWSDFGKGLAYNAERVAAGLLGAGENVTDFLGTGFYKALEGITSLGGLAPNAVSEWSGNAAEKFLQNSISRDYEESIRERYDPSRAEEMSSGVAQSVAQILLDVAVGKGLAKIASGGMALVDDAADAVKASKWGKAVFGTQAAGGGANEAYSEGASTGQALQYGAATGTMEVLIESIAGGIPGLGEGKLSQIVQKVTANPVVNKALDVLGEGGEEGISAILSPFIKRAVYDKDAELATADEIAESVILGIVSSALLQGLEIPGFLSNVTQNSKTAKGLPDDFFDVSLTDPLQVVSNLGTTDAGQKKTASGVETVEESTSVDTDPAKHTPQEQAVIEAYQAGTDESLKETFESYFDRPEQGFSRHNISSVSKRQAADAEALLGGEYIGYKNAINSNGIQHILNEHGPNGTVDTSLADMNDLARMGYILDNYDKVEVVTYSSGEADLSSEFRTKDNEPAPMLKFSKKVNGTYYVVEAIPESKYKKFWVVSAYMQNADSGTQAPNANDPGTTPNASLASSPSADVTVPQATPEVKPESDPLDIWDLSKPMTSGNVSNSGTMTVDEVAGLPMFKRVEPLEKTGAAAKTQQAAENAAEMQQEAEVAALEEIKQLYPKMKAAKKYMNEVREQIELSDEDNRLVSAMVRGLVRVEDLDPQKVNAPEVTKVYRAAAEYEAYARKIREWNKARKQKLKDRADELLETSLQWKDKLVGLLYQRETLERNIRDIVPDENVAEALIAEYYTPVQKNEAESNRTKEAYRTRVKNLNISRSVAAGNEVSEAYAVQLLGEAEDNIRMLKKNRSSKAKRDGKTAQEWEAEIANLWEKSPNLDQDKIRSAVGEFHKIYDELFEQMNEARVRNGYEPVDYRSGYFPHFQADDGGDGLLRQFGKELGIATEVTPLPTSINGITHRFKPGIRWFGNAQKRTGFDTTYDAVEGFDRYINGVADVIHHTDDIQRLRALSGQIRYRSSDEGTRKQLKAIDADTTLSETEKQSMRDEVYKNGKFALGNFVVDLEEYTNLLANKRSQADRNMEQKLGRNAYNVMKKLESRVAANMVAVNPGSWLTNVVALTQGSAGLETKHLLQGMWSTLQSYKTDDSIANQSTFLTNRKGSDPLVQTWQKKASAKLSKPMEVIDQFTAGALVRARYQQNLSEGMSEAAAMDEADSWVAGVMAGRSKGSMPTLFSQQNPITKLFTQFQLEVNNQYSYLFKDIPRDTKEKGTAALAMALLKFAIGAFLYNELYEKLVGRRPALDPIGILNDTVGDLTGYELPNLVDLGVGAVTRDMPSFQTEKTSLSTAAGNLGTALAEELPFNSLLGLAGLDVGRVPIASAIPDVTNFTSGRNIGKELLKPLTYLALPFGGGQVKKAVEGVTAVAKGGSYKKDAEGNDKLQYPVYSDSPLETAANLAKAVTFGKSSLGTAQDWVESGFQTWDAGYTTAYQNMREAGMGEREAYEILSAMKAAEKPAEKLGTLAEQNLSDDMTQKLAGLVLGTELTTEEGNKTAYAKLLDAEKELGLTAAEYLAYYEKYGGQAVGQDKLREAYDLGVGVEDYLDYYAGKKEYDSDGNGSYSTAELIQSIEGSGMTGDARIGMYLLNFPEWGEKAQKNGIGINVFIDYKIATNGLKSKENVLAAINRMRVSSQTKDKLYLVAGYGESGLKDAPWN